MRKVLIVLVAVAFAAVFVSTAYAGTITLGSFGNQGPALAGVDNSALGYVGFTATPPVIGGTGSGVGLVRSLTTDGCAQNNEDRQPRC